MSDQWIEKYIRVPYSKEGEPSFDGFHCWGLVHLVLKLEARIETPKYTQTSVNDLLRVRGHIREAVLTPPWVMEVKDGEEKKFDVVVFRSILRRTEANVHTGIITKSGWCLHTEGMCGCVHMPLKHPHIAHRKVITLRHEALI